MKLCINNVAGTNKYNSSLTFIIISMLNVFEKLYVNQELLSTMLKDSTVCICNSSISLLLEKCDNEYTPPEMIIPSFFFQCEN